MNEEHKYNEFRKKLMSLPKIRAAIDFENKLFQRIRVERESHVPGKHRHTADRKNWILNVFKQPAFAPALGFVSIAFIGLIIYLAFFSQKNEQQMTSQQTPGIQKEYSVNQLETLKSKISSLGTENRDIAKREESLPPSPKLRTEVSEHRSDVESKVMDKRTEEPTHTEDVPLERTAGPEKMEKKETPLMDKDELEKKIEEKGKLDETLGKSIMPSNEKEVLPSKGDDKINQNQQVTQDTTKSQDTVKKKKSKKKEKKSEIPPVEQKIQDTITK